VPEGGRTRPEDPGGFSGPQVCRLVGISYRQLDHWATTGLAVPSLQKARGSGTRRLYSFEDVLRLRLVKKLLDAGVALQKIRAALEALHRMGEDPLKAALVSDGRSIYACGSEEEVIDVLRGGQGMFAIALGPTIRELRGEIASLGLDLPERETARKPAAPDRASEANRGAR
jgi:DNA-binding transcriptional MerR regulator